MAVSKEWSADTALLRDFSQNELAALGAGVPGAQAVLRKMAPLRRAVFASASSQVAAIRVLVGEFP
jgi:hypothetical protein